MASTSSTTKSIVINPGETVILPKDTVIDSIIINGSITVTSTCNNLPDPSSYKCGVFYFFTDMTQGEDDEAMEEEYVQYTSVTVGSNTYIINEPVMEDTGSEPGTATAPETLNIHITDTVVFEFMEIARTVLGDRQKIAVYFKTPEGLFNGVSMQISDRGTVYNLPPYEAECDSYPTPE